METRGKDDLLNGMLADAKNEADEILERSRTALADMERLHKAKMEQVRAEGEKRIGEQKKALNNRAESALSVEKHRITLAAREKLIIRILAEVEAELNGMEDDAEYGRILTDWIVEAAVGLNCDSGRVHSGKKERSLITKDLLRRAEKKTAEASGRMVTLSLFDGPPLTERGVVVVSGDGRTAYNNLLRNRIERFGADIRRIIYRTLTSAEEDRKGDS